MSKAKSGNLSIHYRRLSRDRGLTPILVVHGLSYFSYDWLPVGEALGAEREVILMDMRGFGDSDWGPARDYSVPAMAQDIIAVLDHAGWQQAVLVGHSMGGRAVTCAAAKHPSRAAALVLVDYTPENAPAGANRTAQTISNVPEKFLNVEKAMAYFKSNDRKRFEAYLKRVDGGYQVKRDPYFQELFKSGQRPALGADMWQLIGEVRCPILSLRGARSDIYAPETVAKMQAANQRLRVVEVDAGHNIAGENLPGFLRAMQAFLGVPAHEHQRS
ncbi:MAG: alpha/beta fold hydrolase [Betaproteobacteria bacterium]